ncbi:ATP-binding protein [Paenibacillus dendrobii]|nr:ATP-binding protein [Paenibacillus dendrobii]
MIRILNKTTLKYLAAVLLFCGALFGLRSAWSQVFETKAHPHAAGGVLDLRGWKFNNTSTLSLNGEWQFYPGEFVSRQNGQQAENQPRKLQVPGNWRSAFPQGSGANGYGTYRLRILVDPLDQPVAIWLRGIQASSTVEINGLVQSQVGNPAANANEYTPNNVSYTASYDLKGTQEIEILIRVANFENRYTGGMLKSLRIGSQAAIDYVRWYSIGFQLVAFIILLIHGIYALILYLFNRRERTLFIVGLLTLFVGISIVAKHDNLLMLWLPINYTWGVKIQLLSLVWQTFFILLVFRRFTSAPLKSIWLQMYTTGIIGYTIFILAAPVPLVNASTTLGAFALISGLSFVWFLYVAGTMIFRKQVDPDAIFLLLSGACIASNLLWSFWDSTQGVTHVYYPIDIIAAIVCFSAYWFKKFYRNANENAQLNEQLQQANKLKDQFLANTSHELRTPLHGIMNIAQTVAAKEKSKLDESSLRDMELLITISRRMSLMLGDLLDVARLQEHRIVLQQRPLRIQSVVPGVIGMLKFMSAGKPVELRVNIAESMPPVWADEKRLVQILHNLLHNALKFTEEGTISVSAEMVDGHAVIRVSDTGIGMDKDTQSRIFLPYEQGTYGISDGRGIGLGLSICKQLVELHGGTLSVKSMHGQGSEFSFVLPLADADCTDLQQEYLPSQEMAFMTADQSAGFIVPEPAIAEIAATDVITPLLQEGTMHILVVDDDPVNLNVLVGILSTEPYTITTAHSAREALKLLGTKPWDLLIADVMMPQMSGYELTQKVREHYSISELPILLLTARSQAADIYAGFSAGASDYVTKPVDALELKYRIRALTAMKQSIQERLRMEAAYLQAQIHPHFLFNTLNSIMALSEIDTQKMQDLGDAFASYLRISFDFLNTGELVELSHELKLAEAYLYIEQERFEDRLSVVWEVEPDITLLLPPLTIQPLIENAVRHGLMSQEKGGTVQIRIASREGFTLVEVEDNGKGMEPERVMQLLSPTMKGKGGIGISNTNRRLIQLYGQGLSISSKPGQGTTISFIIPVSQTADLSVHYSAG